MLRKASEEGTAVTRSRRQGQLRSTLLAAREGKVRRRQRVDGAGARGFG
jgi:hypothetical protein